MFAAFPETNTPFDGTLPLLCNEINSQTAAARIIIAKIISNALYLLNTANMTYTPVFSILFLLLEHEKKVYSEIILYTGRRKKVDL